MRVAFGLAAGAAIVFADNIAFDGEVSPIIIVIMLLAATFFAGWMWGRRAWLAAGAAWLCVPMAHLVKHILGLPDTLHPNTLASILMLAAFTFVISLAGMGLGLVLNKMTRTMQT